MNALATAPNEQVEHSLISLSLDSSEANMKTMTARINFKGDS